MEHAATRYASPVISFTPSAALWLKLAVIYLIAGVGLGVVMGASGNFALRPVHAHLNLLGWTTLALAGLVYGAYPEAATSRLARIHFWLHNASLPVMMISLSLLMLGNAEALPILAGSEIVMAAAVIAFACNVFVNVQPVTVKQESGRQERVNRDAVKYHTVKQEKAKPTISVAPGFRPL